VFATGIINLHLAVQAIPRVQPVVPTASPAALTIAALTINVSKILAAIQKPGAGNWLPIRRNPRLIIKRD
jgi:hypothetical protein